MQQGSWTIEAVDLREVKQLARALDLSELTASVLVRRGLGDPGQARAFLEAEAPGNDPFALGDMAEAIERIRSAVAEGKKICVHGDYDVDGIAATVLAVSILEELGADVGWALPSRFDEGYGLDPGMLERLAADGCSLVLTVDCGITAAEEVAQAQELGLEVIVTDHHRPGERLPDCPIVAPRPASYPFAGLCGSGRRLQARRGAVRRRLGVPARSARPRLPRNRRRRRAARRRESLVCVGRSARARQDAARRFARADAHGRRRSGDRRHGAIAFRLAPRINAAGRLGNPGLALELLLRQGRDEAARRAEALEQLNRERQAVEERILHEAIAEVESWPQAKRLQRAYVIAHDDWHEGVIGIVASRLVERYSRPVVLVAGTEGGDWRGSGRSIPAFDLHGGVVVCADLLERFGGHRAAAGFSIRQEKIAQLVERFTAHADSLLSDADLVPSTTVDAIVPPQTKLTLDLCRELERLAPFGLGNPGVLLLAPGCELADLSTCGDGKHLRFRVRMDGADAGGAIAFGLGSQLDRLRRPVRFDVAFRLEENKWNGTVTPQLQVRRVFDAAPRYESLRSELAMRWRAGEESWDAETRAIFAEAGLFGEGGGRRSLLESETFRALLGTEPALAAA